MGKLLTAWSGSVRTFKAGSSANTVLMPVITAPLMARQCCTSKRASAPVIHLDSPDAMAVRPSRLAAIFKRTYGRPPAMTCKNPLFSARASSFNTPTVVLIPAACSMACPLPATSGFGSKPAITTRLTPASISALAHGGVRPKCAQGSKVT